MTLPRLRAVRPAVPPTPAGSPAPAGRKHKVSFTGRAAVLAVVLAALAIALAGPLRQLISQRSQLASVRQGVNSSSQQLKDLQAQDKSWADPSYVAAQARDRLHYVQPGQVPYVTLSPSPSVAPSTTGAPGSDQPWYAQLWSSVQGAAGTPAATAALSPTPTPSPHPTQPGT